MEATEMRHDDDDLMKILTYVFCFLTTAFLLLWLGSFIFDMWAGYGQ